MAQNSCLGGQPIRSFSLQLPNQRPTNQSKVTIHLASNNPPGGYKKQNGTRKPNARGAAAKPGEGENDEKKKKKEKQKKQKKAKRKRKGRNKDEKGNQASDHGEENPTQFKGELNQALFPSNNDDDKRPRWGKYRPSKQATKRATK